MLFRGVPREHPVAFFQTCAKAAAVRYEGNLLLNENHPLHNQILHISDTFEEPEKVNIENKKVNIEEDFTAKTASHVRKLQEDLGKEIVFGRSDVQRVLDLKPTRCTALLREMAEHGIIEPVTGYGKGKYRFRQQ